MFMLIIIITIIADVFLIKKILDNERKKREILGEQIQALTGKYSEAKAAFEQLKHKHEVDLLKMEISSKERFIKELKDEFIKLKQMPNMEPHVMGGEFIPIKKRG